LHYFEKFKKEIHYFNARHWKETCSWLNRINSRPSQTHLSCQRNLWTSCDCYW